MTKAIVFDIGNVLVRWDPDRVYRDLIPEAAARAAFFESVPMEAMNLAGDRDGDLEAKVRALAKAHPDAAHLILPWWERWSDMCWADIPETADYLHRVKAGGWRVFALSNFAMDTFAIAATRWPVLNEFEIAVISGNEGCVKPEARIYELIEERSGLTGADLFFVDDRPENIAAASARGWGGRVFEGPETIPDLPLP